MESNLDKLTINLYKTSWIQFDKYKSDMELLNISIK